MQSGAGFVAHPEKMVEHRQCGTGSSVRPSHARPTTVLEPHQSCCWRLVGCSSSAAAAQAAVQVAAPPAEAAAAAQAARVASWLQVGLVQQATEALPGRAGLLRALGHLGCPCHHACWGTGWLPGCRQLSLCEGLALAAPPAAL